MYTLITVVLLSTQILAGETIPPAHFETYHECMAEGYDRSQKEKPGLGFVCIRIPE